MPVKHKQSSEGSLSGKMTFGKRFFICSFFCLIAIQQVFAASKFNPDKLKEIKTALSNAVQNGQLPGAIIYVWHRDEVFKYVYGYRSLVPDKEELKEDTIFDLASLTKVIATAPSVMILLERGKLNPDSPVKTYIPEFDGEGREQITVRHLLTHTSGLRAGISPNPPWSGYDYGIKLACLEKPRTQPGTNFLYSDINYILLGEIVRRVSGMPLDKFAEKEIFKPLKMNDTGFLPSDEKIRRIAPTQIVGDKPLRGVVHDPVARNMGGVAGHAGLFSTVNDLARFAKMILNYGELDGVRIMTPETVKAMISVQTPAEMNVKRGFGWDIDSGYSKPRGQLFPIGSFGHTGFTGTAIWIDPFSETFWIFLSNRVHPDGKGSVLSLQTMFGTLIAESLRDFDFIAFNNQRNQTAGGILPGLNADSEKQKPQPAEINVLNGIDVLVKNNYAPLKKLRIGLITNHTGHDKNRNSTIDLLRKNPEITLRAIFTPEHGLSGNLDEQVADSKLPGSDIPVYSLYGERKSPTPEQLKDLDALVFDIQDIGCRFYTYISTLKLCMTAAAKSRLKFIVLDRVNPINGRDVEGPVYKGDFSFIACHRLPLRHGMTVGELAWMFNEEDKIGANLIVIPVSGWKREYWFDETCLPWTNPSPNMRSLRAAILYPGIGLLESAISVGRGTDTPFEVIGAPYINELDFAAELNKSGLAGVRFIPVQFTPTYSTFKNTLCKGVSIFITDREKISAVDVGFTITILLQKMYPQNFDLRKVNALLKDDKLVEAIRNGKPLSEIKKLWENDLNEFRKRREKYLIYK